MADETLEQMLRRIGVYPSLARMPPPATKPEPVEKIQRILLSYAPFSEVQHMLSLQSRIRHVRDGTLQLGNKTYNASQFIGQDTRILACPAVAYVREDALRRLETYFAHPQIATSLIMDDPVPSWITQDIIGAIWSRFKGKEREYIQITSRGNSYALENASALLLTMRRCTIPEATRELGRF